MLPVASFSQYAAACYTMHMSNDQLDDLKQFISASISQSEERVKKELKEEISSSVSQSEGRLREEIQAIRQEMSDGFLGVGEAIDEMHKQIAEQSAVTDRRLTKLEQQLA